MATETQEKIDLLKRVIKAHTIDWASLGITIFDQTIFPRKSSLCWGNCGCAAHTMMIVDPLFFEIGLPLSQTEQEWIFGSIPLINSAAFHLGFPIPKSFTKEDLVDRCNLLIDDSQRSQTMIKSIEKKIKALDDIIKAHTIDWDSLEIAKYDQDLFPEEGKDGDWGNCGCATHTMRIIDPEYCFGGFVFSSTEFNWIFGTIQWILFSSPTLGFSPPTSFTKEDLVNRCELLKDKLIKESSND